MKVKLLALTMACALALTCAAADDEKWVNLIDGSGLDGWEQKGGKASFAREGGEIVGTSVPNTGNSFLCSKKGYSNFILEFEFKGHSNLNSGVQIRSLSLADYRNYRVHGYQVELEDEANERGWSVGIYDEARRGWLFPMKGDDAAGKVFGEQQKKVWKTGEWNHVRVEARGASIKTWLNGELRADLQDDMTPSGFIGLQVHGVGDKETPMSVRWRNMRIKELR